MGIVFYSFKGPSSLCRWKTGRLSWLWTQKAMLKQDEIKIMWVSSPVLHFLGLLSIWIWLKTTGTKLNLSDTWTRLHSSFWKLEQLSSNRYFSVQFCSFFTKAFLLWLWQYCWYSWEYHFGLIICAENTKITLTVYNVCFYLYINY